MSLSDQDDFYRQTLEMSRNQLLEIDVQIEKELADVRERLALLQSKRKAALQMYGAACTMLGIDNDLEKDLAEASETDPSV